MSKIIKFLRLELLALKPGFGKRRVIMLLMFSALGYFVSGAIGLYMGLFPLMLLSTYLFSTGKDGLDALYMSLAITRKSMVTNRYIFLILVNLAGMLFFIFGGFAISIITSEQLNFEAFAILGVSFFIICTSCNFTGLPILFKHGLKRMKLLVVLVTTPFMFLVMVAWRAINDMGMDILTIDMLTDNILWAMLAFSSWCVIMVTSFVLSLRFYNRRDF